MIFNYEDNGRANLNLHGLLLADCFCSSNLKQRSLSQLNTDNFIYMNPKPNGIGYVHPNSDPSYLNLLSLNFADWLEEALLMRGFTIDYIEDHSCTVATNGIKGGANQYCGNKATMLFLAYFDWVNQHNKQMYDLNSYTNIRYNYEPEVYEEYQTKATPHLLEAIKKQHTYEIQEVRDRPQRKLLDSFI